MSSSLASGYDVEIQSIDSSEYSKVTLDVIVRDKDGLPVVGLPEGNFYLTEMVRRTTQVDEGGKAVVRTEETIEPVSDAAYLVRRSDRRLAPSNSSLSVPPT